MAEITAATVAKLREMTNAGLMECKKALTESNGDIDAAVDILRKKGAASAAKKASRDAKEGVIAQAILPGSKVGVIVEINCETDFVARNESFRAFCDEVATKIAQNPSVDLESDRTAQVAKIGENIKISRFERLAVDGAGHIGSYIHTGAKVGVLLEVGVKNQSVTEHTDFKQLVRDLTLQIAAAAPVCVSREQVSPDLIAKEREIAAEQVKGKPPQVVEGIVKGKLEKYYQTVCLVDQGFVKRNSEITVRQHLEEEGKRLGDSILVKRFIRFQVGS
ncbi:MAG: translation elongation factor Ts [Verrucomicrobia bacterium]|nr:translation elongation factor Ts [Verrucomicrobiota bacterium]